MFFDRFKKLCDEKGVTPTRVSAEAGFSAGSVSYWKKSYKAGKDAKPDSYTAEKLAEYFGVSVDYLLGRTDDPIDYDNPDLIAEAQGHQLDGLDGDVKKWVELQDATALDVAIEKEMEKRLPLVVKQYMRLDAADQRYVDGVIAGLLQQDKYKGTEANLA